MLDLAGIPLRSEKRKMGDPFVIGGGPGALNPEPLAPFFDFFVIGDGEEILPELLHEFAHWKEGLGRGGLVIDSRPSDAIALALRCEAPIYMADKLVEFTYDYQDIISSEQTDEGLH